MTLLQELYKKLLWAQEQLNIYQAKQSKGTKLYQVTMDWLDKDASPDNIAPSEVACAETLTFLINKVDPTIKWTSRTSTSAVNGDLSRMTKKFQVVQLPRAGDIRMSPSIYRNGELIHGHCAVFLDSYWMASNDSKSGKLRKNYTNDSWAERYRDKLGLQIINYRML